MGRKRPHSDTTECITRSDRVQNSQIHVFFEVPPWITDRKESRDTEIPNNPKIIFLAFS